MYHLSACQSVYLSVVCLFFACHQASSCHMSNHVCTAHDGNFARSSSLINKQCNGSINLNAVEYIGRVIRVQVAEGHSSSWNVHSSSELKVLVTLAHQPRISDATGDITGIR